MCLDITVATPIDIKPNWSKIKESKSKSFNSFPLYLKINNVEIDDILITLNLQSMIQLINDGYRPNKHDRNTIALFNELIQSILSIGGKSQEIIFIENQTSLHLTNIEDEIEVLFHED